MVVHKESADGQWRRSSHQRAGPDLPPSIRVTATEAVCAGNLGLVGEVIHSITQPIVTENGGSKSNCTAAV
jgi:hypothetical protein